MLQAVFRLHIVGIRVCKIRWNMTRRGGQREPVSGLRLVKPQSVLQRNDLTLQVFHPVQQVRNNV